MTPEEANLESLECARYGEDDELRELFVSGGADANYADHSGTTAMHRAAANGELGCMKILKDFGSKHTQNLQGNFPIHWAALNGQEAALTFLFDNYEVDVLTKNQAGRSTLSEAFQTQKTEIIACCLSHSSATEEALLRTDADTKITVDGDDAEKHAVVHEMDFNLNPIKSGSKQSTGRRHILRIRELPITRADNPFGSETAPEDDTTGLGIWPAAVLLSRWVVQRQDMLRGKVVAELGAGCGLPALAAAIYCGPREVYLTDIHDPTLSNAAHNARLNAYKPSTQGNEGEGGGEGEEEGDDGNITIKMRSRENEKYLEEVEVGTVAERDVSNMDIQRMHITSDDAIAQPTQTLTAPVELTSTLRVAKVSWSDPSTFPPKADVLIGSDLVYDSKILTLLTQAVDGMLKSGGTFLYVAPDECRDGIDGLIASLQRVNVNCVLKEQCPEWMYENPFAGSDDSTETENENDGKMDVEETSQTNTHAATITTENTQHTQHTTMGGSGIKVQDPSGKQKQNMDRGDSYVLHFYDLAARKPHSLYEFVKA